MAKKAKESKAPPPKIIDVDDKVKQFLISIAFSIALTRAVFVGVGLGALYHTAGTDSLGSHTAGGVAGIGPHEHLYGGV